MSKNLLKKDIITLISENSDLDCGDKIYTTEEVDEFESEIKKIPELQSDLYYEAMAIPVFKTQYNDIPIYVVEYDMLNKYIQSNDKSIEDSIDSICSENEINKSDLYIAIESDDYLIQEVKSCKKKYDKQNKNKISKSLDELKKIKKKGIKLIKKKSLLK